MKASLILSFLHAATAAVLSTSTQGSAGNVAHARETIYSVNPGDSRLTTIYQFPNNTWVENIAARKDGKLLVTLVTSPEVHLIDPISRTQELVYRFPNATSTTGIVELDEGLFTLAVGNTKSARASWSVWTLDYRRRQDTRKFRDIPRIKKVTDIPEAKFLNGLTPLPTEKNTALIADSARGVIYRLNAISGSHVLAIDEPALKPNNSVASKLGVNGIHSRTEAGTPYLYFTNTFSVPLLGRFPLHANGSVAGPVETVVAHAPYPLNGGFQADDFAFDREGNVFVASDPSGTLAKVTLPGGKVTVVAGGANDTAIAGDTSAAFGRTRHDRDTLYIVTNGGIAFPPPGGVVGGKVIAFDTRGL